MIELFSLVIAWLYCFVAVTHVGSCCKHSVYAWAWRATGSLYQRRQYVHKKSWLHCILYQARGFVAVTHHVYRFSIS
jgi:hypothetical protein